MASLDSGSFHWHHIVFADARMGRQPSQMRSSHPPVSESAPKQAVTIMDLDRPMIARYPGPSLDRQYPSPPGPEVLRHSYSGL